MLHCGSEVVSVHFALDGGSWTSQLADLAQAANIPSSHSRPTASVFAAFTRQKVDLMLVNGYPYRLPIGSTTLRGVNIYPTLLPEGRGPWPFPWTILSGLQRSGVTTHKLVEAMDAGDILLQTAYPVEAVETFDSLVAKYQIEAPKHIH